MTNNKGYAEIITVSIILGIIGALFITGVYVWQEIESNKQLQTFVNKVNEKPVDPCQKNKDMNSCRETTGCNIISKSGDAEGIGTTDITFVECISDQELNRRQKNNAPANN